MTRVPKVPANDLLEIQNILDNPNVRFVFHNAKFDLRALETLGLDTPPWEYIEDTLIASHVLASGEFHGLKDLAIKYLDIDNDDEEKLGGIIKNCRTIAKSFNWSIACKGHPCFPALSNTSWWKMDMWLPQALHDNASLPAKHEYLAATPRYARLDPIRTLGLWQVFFEALEDEHLLTQYRERIHLIRVTDSMENRGITLSQERLTKMSKDFGERQEAAKDFLVVMSKGLVLNPNSPAQLSKYLYSAYDLPVLTRGKSGTPSTSVKALAKIQEEYAITTEAAEYIEGITKYRKIKKSMEYMTSYEYGSLPLFGHNPHTRNVDKSRKWQILHPEFNITGTRTTRFSSRNPNAQNIGKQDGYNLREIFGPAPGRVWFAIDYSNIEMRIFAYQSDDCELIKAFESGQLVHMIFAELLHPKEFAKCKRSNVSFKDKYKATLYQNTKNGNFSLIYGANPRTADYTYKVRGAYDLIRKRLPKIDAFIQRMHHQALQQGYVTTLGGYRLQVPSMEPHKACNYFIQGSAGWAIIRAMNRVHNYLQRFPDYHLIMQVHDELVFDFPQHPRNPTVIRKIRNLMEQSGMDIGIPLPVEVDRITTDWAHGESYTL